MTGQCRWICKQVPQFQFVCFFFILFCFILSIYLFLHSFIRSFRNGRLKCAVTENKFALYGNARNTLHVCTQSVSAKVGSDNSLETRTGIIMIMIAKLSCIFKYAAERKTAASRVNDFFYFMNKRSTSE